VSGPGDLELRLPGGRVAPEAAVRWRATTSGGPGGQHANRTASRVEVVVRIDDLGLEPREVALVYERLASRITGAGELTTACSEHRDQHRNRRVALRRMERLVEQALTVRRTRIPTRMSKGAKLRRQQSKQQQAQRKRSRGWRPTDDDA
jgi:ribosome-associated protein